MSISYSYYAKYFPQQVDLLVPITSQLNELHQDQHQATSLVPHSTRLKVGQNFNVHAQDQDQYQVSSYINMKAP